MPKNLKIIIVIISVLVTILAIYIAPRFIPYTPPSPNIVKTDQGSFELVLNSNSTYSYELYKAYLFASIDYFERIAPILKTNSLVVNANHYDSGEGINIDNITMSINNSKNMYFTARYDWGIVKNKVEYKFRGFPKYLGNEITGYYTLQELLQTQEYQNFKSN